VTPRRIAFFPGAFRPPHRAHHAAIAALAARDDIDEVVVIVANRSRMVPGTTLALDAPAVRGLLERFVAGLPKVRIEIARHDAISQALGYLDTAAPGDTLRYCIGEADLGGGDDRFDDLAERGRRAGVDVAVIPAPTGGMTVRATHLRQALAGGEGARERFMAALPEWLDADARHAAWEACRAGLRPVHEVVADKLRGVLDPALAATIVELRCVRPGKLDPVHRARLINGDSLVIKYAGDTVEAGAVGDPAQPKPRRRLGTERRAVRELRRHGIDDVALPEVVSFDRETLTLVLTDVCPEGASLDEALRSGVIRAGTMATLGRLLARCHAAGGSVPALWGDRDTDLAHWRAMLAVRIARARHAFPDATARLDRLAAESDAARIAGIHHLDITLRNVRQGARELGVVDWELAAHTGDPAFDLGGLVGEVHRASIACERIDQGAGLVHELLDAYRQSSRGAWPAHTRRVAAFAAIALLAQPAGSDATTRARIARSAGRLMACLDRPEPLHVRDLADAAR